MLKIDQEFRKMIPPLTDDEYRGLEESILKEGCREPILTWDGTILDGHNRFFVCIAHGVVFETEALPLDSREEARLWMLENQFGRRNLTDAAKIELVMHMRELSKSSKVESVELKNENVGYGTLHRYNEIKKEGSPALLELVASGAMKIGTAHRLLPKELKKQLKAADKALAYIEKHMPGEDEDPSIKADVYGLIAELTDQLQVILQQGVQYEAKN